MSNTDTFQKSDTSKIIEETARVDQDAMYIERYIHDIANPSPVLVIAMVVIILLVVYFVYYYFVRETISGKWHDEKQIAYIISTDLLTNNLTYTIGDDVAHGVKNGYHITMGKKNGVWNGSNHILFVDGMSLYR